MIDILGFGACVFDTLVVTENFPLEDTKQKCNNTIIAGGGPVSTALVAGSKLGKTCKFIGYLSDDYYSKFLISDFEKYNVNTKDIIIEEGKLAFHSFIILSKESGSRTCLYNRGSVNEEIEKINTEIIKNTKILHLDGNYIKTAIKLAKIAKENNVIVSLDAGGLYYGIEKLLPYVDILIPSEEFALAFTNKNEVNQAIIKLKEKYNPKILVVTQGKDGGLYYNQGINRYKGYKVNAVDTNGAGDVFHGAFLVAYLNGLEIADCCDFASKVSAIKCTNIGARQSIPNLQTVEKFIFNT